MIHYYDENAQTFFNDTENLDRSMHYEDFLSLIPIGGKILDASCTAGQDSVIFMNRGYEVVAMDGAIEMCKLAGEYMGEEVDHMQFQEVDFAPIFDGIWAAASLMPKPKWYSIRFLQIQRFRRPKKRSLLLRPYPKKSPSHFHPIRLRYPKNVVHRRTPPNQFSRKMAQHPSQTQLMYGIHFYFIPM